MIQKIMNETKDHIILDCIETWPNELVSYLESKLSDDEYSNHKTIIEDFRSDIVQILHQTKFIGFNCTRLTDEEIKSIKTEGLNLNRSELFARRIDFLKKNNNAFFSINNLNPKEESYNGIFFNHCIRHLKDEYSYNRLFGFWGGESLYNHFDGCSDLLKIITEIGKPCIIIAPLNYKEIKLADLPNNLLKTYLNYSLLPSLNQLSNNYDDTYIFDSDSLIQCNVKVLNIIEYDNELFEQLTNYSSWNDVLNLI
jgi:hypothetical protein